MKARLHHPLAARMHAEPHATQRCGCVMQKVMTVDGELEVLAPIFTYRMVAVQEDRKYWQVRP